MSDREERVDKALARLKRVDDERLDSLTGHGAGQALFEEVVSTDQEQRPMPRRQGTRARRRSLLLRAGVAAAAVVAVVGVLSVIDPFGSSGLTTVQQAAAALTPADGQILHTKMLGEQTNPDGSVVTWSDESWQATAAPFDRRQIETSPQGTVVESATVGDVTQLYDAANDTIYVASTNGNASPAPSPKVSGAPSGLPPLPKVSGAPSPDKIIEIAVSPDPTSKEVRVTIISKVDGTLMLFQKTMGAKKAKMFVVAVTARNPEVEIGPSADTTPPSDSTEAQAEADPFRGKILSLLQSGKVHEDGRLSIDGREAIRLVRTYDATEGGGREVYIVDATTYAPIELRTQGDGGGTVLRFVVYETLPDSSATRALLDIKAQHPDARIDRDPAHYQAASARLFPNG